MDFYLILFAGNTEQAFLNNYEDIVDSSLPVQKVMNLFPDKEAAEDSVLAKISYREERTEVCLTSFYCDIYYLIHWILSMRGTFHVHMYII